MVFRYLGWTQAVFDSADAGNVDMLFGGTICLLMVVFGLMGLAEIKKDSRVKRDTEVRAEVLEAVTFMGAGFLPLLIATWPFAAIASLALLGYLGKYLWNLVAFAFNMLFGTSNSSQSNSSQSGSTTK